MSPHILAYAILLSAPLLQAALVGAVAWGAGWPVALTGAALVIPAAVATLVWLAFSIEWVLA